MAGHSKWANIKHRKGAQDAARSKIFAKLAKEIMVAAANGADPSANSSLRLAIIKAKAKSMPKANIEKAIAKAAGVSKEGQNFKELIYSGTIQNGIVVLIVFLTNNVNRSAANVQAYFNKFNGKIGKQGSIPFVFDLQGLIEFDLQASNLDSKKVEEQILEYDIENYQIEDGICSVFCKPNNFTKLKESIEQDLKIENFISAEISYIPNIKISPISKEKAETFVKFIDKLEDDDDVKAIYHNADLSILKTNF